MLKKILITSLAVAFASLHAQVDFRHITTSTEMEEAWSDASNANKLLFVDIYATWCGPCKWMDANVFALQEAGEFMNKEFINVKMDGESEFGRQFAMQAGLSAYPSFFIYSSDKEMMNKMMGAKPWEEFKPMLLSTVEYYPVLTLLQSKFESGILEKAEYASLAKACREMGKEKYGYAVAGTYEDKFVNENHGITANDIRVLAFYTALGSEFHNKMMSDVPLFKEALGEELTVFIDQSLSGAIEKSVEEGNLQHINNLVKVLPELTEGTYMDPDFLEARAYIYYYHYSEMFDELIKYIDSEYEESHKGDHAWLFESASNAVFLDPRNKMLAAKGVEWFSKCIELQETADYYYYLGLTQYYNKQPKQTITSLKRAAELSDDQEFVDNVHMIIKEIEEEIDS